eukprot:Clim_evm37s229 gene=Clim_evmTU37s229
MQYSTKQSITWTALFLLAGSAVDAQYLATNSLPTGTIPTGGDVNADSVTTLAGGSQGLNSATPGFGYSVELAQIWGSSAGSQDLIVGAPFETATVNTVDYQRGSVLWYGSNGDGTFASGVALSPNYTRKTCETCEEEHTRFGLNFAANTISGDTYGSVFYGSQYCPCTVIHSSSSGGVDASPDNDEHFVHENWSFAIGEVPVSGWRGEGFRHNHLYKEFSADNSVSSYELKAHGSTVYADPSRSFWIVGDPEASVDGLSYAGLVSIFNSVHWSTNFPTPIWTVSGTQSGADFGYTLCTADVNGDGNDDIVVGSPLYSSSSVRNAGRVDIYLAASSSSWSTTPDFTIVGNNSGDEFGRAIANLGDLNGDGAEDLAIGAPFAGAGVVQIYAGNDSGSGDVVSLWQSIEGLNDGDQFGFSISRGGSVDSGSSVDCAIGAPGVGSGAGSVYVLRNVAATSITLQANLQNPDGVDSKIVEEGTTLVARMVVQNDGVVDTGAFVVNVSVPRVSNGVWNAPTSTSGLCSLVAATNGASWSCSISNVAAGATLNMDFVYTFDATTRYSPAVSFAIELDATTDVILGSTDDSLTVTLQQSATLQYTGTPTPVIYNDNDDSETDITIGELLILKDVRNILNLGISTAFDVKFDIALPGGLTFREVRGTGSGPKPLCSGLTSVTCSLTSQLAKDQTYSAHSDYELVFSTTQVTSPTLQLDIRAFSSGTGSITESTNTINVAVSSSELSVAETVVVSNNHQAGVCSGNELVAGSTFSMSFIVANIGNGDAANPVFSLDLNRANAALPLPFSLVNGAMPRVRLSDGTTVNCSQPDAVGEPWEFDCDLNGYTITAATSITIMVDGYTADDATVGNQLTFSLSIDALAGDGSDGDKIRTDADSNINGNGVTNVVTCKYSRILASLSNSPGSLKFDQPFSQTYRLYNRGPSTVDAGIDTYTFDVDSTVTMEAQTDSEDNFDTSVCSFVNAQQVSCNLPAMEVNEGISYSIENIRANGALNDGDTVTVGLNVDEASLATNGIDQLVDTTRSLSVQKAVDLTLFLTVNDFDPVTDASTLYVTARVSNGATAIQSGDITLDLVVPDVLSVLSSDPFCNDAYTVGSSANTLEDTCTITGGLAPGAYKDFIWSYRVDFPADLDRLSEVQIVHSTITSADPQGSSVELRTSADDFEFETGADLEVILSSVPTANAANNEPFSMSVRIGNAGTEPCADVSVVVDLDFDEGAVYDTLVDFNGVVDTLGGAITTTPTTGGATLDTITITIPSLGGEQYVVVEFKFDISVNFADAAEQVVLVASADASMTTPDTDNSNNDDLFSVTVTESKSVIGLSISNSFGPELQTGNTGNFTIVMSNYGIAAANDPSFMVEVPGVDFPIDLAELPENCGTPVQTDGPTSTRGLQNLIDAGTYDLLSQSGERNGTDSDDSIYYYHFTCTLDPILTGNSRSTLIRLGTDSQRIAPDNSTVEITSFVWVEANDSRDVGWFDETGWSASAGDYATRIATYPGQSDIDKAYDVSIRLKQAVSGEFGEETQSKNTPWWVLFLIIFSCVVFLGLCTWGLKRAGFFKRKAPPKAGGEGGNAVGPEPVQMPEPTADDDDF